VRVRLITDPAEARHFHRRFFRLWAVLTIVNCALVYFYFRPVLHFDRLAAVVWTFLNVAMLAVIAGACALVMTGFAITRACRRSRCLNCRADLTGNQTGVCPECGWEMPARQREWLATSPEQ
jgi:hypothetical protein